VVLRALVLGLIALMVIGAIALYFPAQRVLGGSLFVAACLCMLLLRRSRPDLFEPRERIEVDAWGVRRFIGPRQTEALTWGELVRVSVTTTRSARSAEGRYLMLHGRDGGGVAVSEQLAEASGLIELLKRLPGLDRDALARGAAGAEAADTVCWEGTAGDGLSVARALEEQV
jgi:hypothetical protein